MLHHPDDILLTTLATTGMDDHDARHLRSLDQAILDDWFNKIGEQNIWQKNPVCSYIILFLQQAKPMAIWIYLDFKN